MSYRFPFLKLLSHLGKDSEQLVLVGGWVPAVYFTYLWTDEFFLVTKDIDFGIGQEASLSPIFEEKIGSQYFQRKHLKIGREKPYQLIYEDSPVDFLTTPENLERVQKQVLGANLLINSSEDYDELLQDPLRVNWDGIWVKVPQPARYLLHKINLYLKSYPQRQRDIATAYYCLCNKDFRNAVSDYLPKILQSKATKTIQEKLPALIRPAGLAIKDIQEAYAQYGRSENPKDISNRFEWLLSLLSKKA